MKSHKVIIELTVLSDETRESLASLYHELNTSLEGTMHKTAEIAVNVDGAYYNVSTPLRYEEWMALGQ